MRWVRLDTQFYGNTKVATTSLESIGVYVLGLTFAGDHLTNGVIPAHALPMTRARPKHIRELERAGLWVPVSGGWVIHDYLEHQQSREHVEAVREQTRERMRQWRARRNGNGS